MTWAIACSVRKVRSPETNELIRLKIEETEFNLHGKKSSTCCNVVENNIEQCCAVIVPHCSRLLTTLNNIVTPDLGSTILFNVVDNYE